MFTRNQLTKSAFNVFACALSYTVISAALYSSELPSQSDPVEAEWTDEEAEEQLYRVRVGAVRWFNVGVSFGSKGFGNDPGPAEAGKDHFYDDGYNRVDVTGNGANLTSYWGYDNASQVTEYSRGGPPGSIDFHAGRSAGGFDDDVDSDWGFEVELARELGKLGEKGEWGVTVAVSFLTLDDDADGDLDFTVITDTYQHFLDPFPDPGHRGGFDDTTNLIGDEPSRVTSTATGTGSRDFDADVWTIRLGPYVEYPITESIFIEASAGLAAVMVDGEFSYSDSYSFDGEDYSSSGDKDEDDWLFGAFIGATANWQVNEDWSVYGGASWLGVEDYESDVDGREVEVDFSQGYMLRLGIGYSF